MYIPPKYRNEDPEAIRRFIREHAFGILVSGGAETPMATHLPLELEEAGNGQLVLCGHFARANPQWQHIADGQQVLCIFNGPHAYVSSSWYQQEEVPTWNYMAVHLTGTYRQQTEAELWASLHRLVDRYEADSEAPVRLQDLSEATLRQVRGIVGFTITATRLEAAFKLSQGREQDHPRIVSELQRRGGASGAVADAMQGPESL
ncbi:FMN-binding negative transcriptional regulator [Robiginitalea sp. M366]|uniref:FMN-binding negative transcriptional regulator n=1 Tax=Robiginitalea aestuariiviva TaxID=3036903 RepID=UPI00240DB801|nr:FMN-binding negative transcriptional regulator [Robiginitalea aestuariiviva]MDG1573409.1 FMN-binding negative transcriptional regulator [Robiginitalea aestuariiviva]